MVDLREAASDINVAAMLAALHRASPRASFVAVGDALVSLPGYCSRVRCDDGAALGALCAAK